MDNNNTTLSPNSLAFIALSNEYCAAMEAAATMSPLEFAKTMLESGEYKESVESKLREGLGKEMEFVVIPLRQQ